MSNFQFDGTSAQIWEGLMPNFQFDGTSAQILAGLMPNSNFDGTSVDLFGYVMPKLKSIPLHISTIKNNKKRHFPFLTNTVLSKDQREYNKQSIKRYREKKAKYEQLMKNNVRHESRSMHARSRLRIGGTFVSSEDENILKGLVNDKEKYDKYVEFIKKKRKLKNKKK